MQNDECLGAGVILFLLLKFLRRVLHTHSTITGVGPPGLAVSPLALAAEAREDSWSVAFGGCRDHEELGGAELCLVKVCKGGRTSIFKALF